MLKGIPNIISPELLKILDEMGHGDTIVIGDGNFPAASNAQRLVRCDGHNVPELLDAILKLMPLDSYVETPAMLMATTKGDPTPTIWAEYQEIINKNNGETKMGQFERFEFYDEAKKGKSRGTLTNADIDAFSNMLSPMLDDSKRKILRKIVNELKKI